MEKAFLEQRELEDSGSVGGTTYQWSASVEPKGLRVVTTTNHRRRRSILYPLGSCLNGSPSEELIKQRRELLQLGWKDTAPPVETPEQEQHRRAEEAFGHIGVDWF